MAYREVHSAEIREIDTAQRDAAVPANMLTQADDTRS